VKVMMEFEYADGAFPEDEPDDDEELEENE